MAIPKFKALGTSITSRLDNTERREVFVSCLRYGQMLDYTDFPDLWLPWNLAPAVAVQCGPIHAGRVERHDEPSMTDAIMTLQPRLLSYWHGAGPRWSIEETISVAAAPPDNEQECEENETENSDIANRLATAPILDPYYVQEGDTLGTIAKRADQTIARLERLNDLAGSDPLVPGQSVYLSETSAFAVSVLFLDALRHPIEKLPYKLIADGKPVHGKTGANGMATPQVTRSAQSKIEVMIQDVQGQWHSLFQTASGYGHKLITLVSGALVFSGRTEPYPTVAPSSVAEIPKRATVNKQIQAPLPPPAQGLSSTNNPAVKTKKVKGAQGQPVLKIEVDIPQELLKFFANYTGQEITEKDWQEAAGLLECEPAVLKAFAEVESGGRSSFWRLNDGDGAHIPAILYERHYFSELTKNKYDKDHPDLSWPTGYRKKALLGERDSKMFSGRVETRDIYSDYASAYLRLINAYRLDASAALKSSSWGKFQIMGQNYSLCGASDHNQFIAKMCTSEMEQIRLLVQFIRKKPRTWKNRKNKALGKEISLWDAVKTKNWSAIAFNYNGPGYKKYNYDAKMEKAYEKYSAKSA